MNSLPTYQTWIPENAVPKQKRGSGMVEYYIGKELVGRRYFELKEGFCRQEIPYRNGVAHGWVYEWHEANCLVWAEFFENGLSHGTATQWDREGNVIGRCTMERGTGFDLWWQPGFDGDPPYLGEARCMQDGALRCEWRFSAGDLYHEVPWHEGKPHGVERYWNHEGELRSGYPIYWVNGEQISFSEYLLAAQTDATLPPYRAEDDLPIRDFPPEIRKHLPQPKAL